MKSALLLCAFAVAGVLAVTPAHADSTFSLTFSGCFGNSFNHCSSGTPYSDGGDVSFTIAQTPTTPGFGHTNSYDITDITGTVDIGGDSYTIGALQTGHDSLSGSGNNNNLDLNHSGDYSLDDLDFALTGTGPFDELLLNRDDTTGEYTETLTYNCGTSRHPKTCTYTDTDTTTDRDINECITLDQQQQNPPSPTPEPGSLALLGTAILGGAGALRRRFHV